MRIRATARRFGSEVNEFLDVEGEADRQLATL
jgi:hypothetical protein